MALHAENPRKAQKSAVPYLLAGLGLGVGPMEGTPPLAPEESAPTVGLLPAAAGGGGPGPLEEGL